VAVERDGTCWKVTVLSLKGCGGAHRSAFWCVCELGDLEISRKSKLVSDLQIPSPKQRCIDSQQQLNTQPLLRVVYHLVDLDSVSEEIQLQDINDVATCLANLL
jgi:hypothetical protein